jgi:hypothetical protein
MLRLIRKAVASATMLPTLDLSWKLKAARRKRNKSWLCCMLTPESANKAGGCPDKSWKKNVRTQ